MALNFVTDSWVHGLQTRWKVISLTGVSWADFADRVNSLEAPILVDGRVEASQDTCAFSAQGLSRGGGTAPVYAKDGGDRVYLYSKQENQLRNLARVVALKDVTSRYEGTGGTITGDGAPFFDDPLFRGDHERFWSGAEFYGLVIEEHPAEAGDDGGAATATVYCDDEVVIDQAEFERLFSTIDEWLPETVAVTMPSPVGAEADEDDDPRAPALPSPADIGAALKTHKNILVEGVAGCGKSHLRSELTKIYGADRVEFVVFHPSTTYEEFVRGVRPNLGDEAEGRGGDATPATTREPEFSIVDGLFLEWCKKAWDSPGDDFLLFIDEINRANTSRVLGDLLYGIERSQRVDPPPKAEQRQGALSPDRTRNAIRLLIHDDDHPQYLSVPGNLHILGTMNSTDRSVGTIDLALARRFHKIRLEPLGAGGLAELLRRQIPAQTWGAEGLEAERDETLEWYGRLNSTLKEKIGPDAMVGHSHFLKAPPTGADNVREYLDDVVRSILNQTVEVIRTFAVHDQVVQGLPGHRGQQITLTGAGLGRGPVITAVGGDADRASDDQPYPAPSPEVAAGLQELVSDAASVREKIAPGARRYTLWDAFATRHEEPAPDSEIGRKREESATYWSRLDFAYDAIVSGRAPSCDKNKELRRQIRNAATALRGIDSLDSEVAAHLDAVLDWIESAAGRAGQGRQDGAEHLPAALSRYKNVVLEGVSGSGKSYTLRRLEEQYGDRVEFVVFHPSTTYEDFVRGMRPNFSAQRVDGDREFAIKEGAFIEFCERAAADREQDYLLFIDEINRANTARVLGDLLYAIENTKRDGDAGNDTSLSEGPRENSVRILISDDDHQEYLSVPDNIHILATMNSTDRSVGSLDLALQRRFHRMIVKPLDAEGLKRQLADHFADRDRLDDRVTDLVRWYAQLNSDLEEQIGPDALIGHSYFFAPVGDGDDEAELIRNYLEDVSTDVFNQLIEVLQMFSVRDVEQFNYDHPLGWSVKALGQGLGAVPTLDKGDAR